MCHNGGAMSVDVSLIVPTYNEAENIRTLLARAEQALKEFSHEIIVVDDNSPDKTAAIATQEENLNPQIRVQVRKGKKDLSRSVVEGFDLARGSVLVVMDADLCTIPSYYQRSSEALNRVRTSRSGPDGFRAEAPTSGRGTVDSLPPAPLGSPKLFCASRCTIR